MKVPISAKEALAAVDPSLPDDEKMRAAENIMAGVAANDAYLNSRSEIEQALALARGGRVAAPHADREAEAGKQAESTSTELTKSGSIESEIVTDAEIVAKKAEEAFPGEAEVIKKRLAELTGGVL